MSLRRRDLLFRIVNEIYIIYGTVLLQSSEYRLDNSQDPSLSFIK